MNEFEIAVDVNCPIDEVFAFMGEPENLPTYNPSVTEAHLTSEGPIGIGTTMVMSSRFLGRDSDTTWEVTDYKLNELMAEKTTSGPFYMELTLTFESIAEGGTRLTQHVRGDSRGFFKFAEPVVIRIFRKQSEASLETLKELLEAGAGSPS